MGSAGVDVASNGVAGLIEDTIGETPYAQGGEVKDTPASGARGPSLHWLKLRPAGALRLAFRLPIYLYRLDLGWLPATGGYCSSLGSIRAVCSERPCWR